MVEFTACALIVSGFWMLLELGKFLLTGLRRREMVTELSVPPGGEYIERYADAFRRLSESYRELPKRKEHLGEEELEHMIQRMRNDFCMDCGRQKACWGEQYYYLRRSITSYLNTLENEGYSQSTNAYCWETPALPYRSERSFYTERQYTMEGSDRKKNQYTMEGSDRKKNQYTMEESDHQNNQYDAEGTYYPEMEFSSDFSCSFEQDFYQELYRIYLDERTDMMWNNRLLEQRAAAGEQLWDTARLLSSMAERLYQIRGLGDREYMKLKKELQYEKIECKSAWICCRDEAHPEFYVTLRMDGANCIPAKEMAELFSRLLRRRMVPARDCRVAVKRGYETFHFVTDTEYQMFCGIARMTKEGELVSGDNYAFWQSDGGQLVMSLADGMGAGMPACRESEKVIELLEQFLDAGFSQDTAVRMLNSSLILQDHRKIYSTIDLCMVDLYNGTCSMIKAGACPSYLIRGGNVEEISCAALPAGILQSADYKAISRKLISGDILIIMSDGAADAMPDENRTGFLKEVIGRIHTENMKELSARLLEAILIRQNLRVLDDMTVLVGQIRDK